MVRARCSDHGRSVGVINLFGALRLLGSDVLALVRAKFADLQEELAQWEHLTRSTGG